MIKGKRYHTSWVRNFDRHSLVTGLIGMAYCIASYLKIVRTRPSGYDVLDLRALFACHVRQKTYRETSDKSEIPQDYFRIIQPSLIRLCFHYMQSTVTQESLFLSGRLKSTNHVIEEPKEWNVKRTFNYSEWHNGRNDWASKCPSPCFGPILCVPRDIRSRGQLLD